MRFFILFLSFTAASLQADTLGELKAKLDTLQGGAPLKAEVRLASTAKAEGDNGSAEAKASIGVEEGPQGLRITWPSELIAKLGAENIAKAKDPEVKTPTRAAVEELDTTSVYEYLHAAEVLQRRLEQASFLGETQEVRDGVSLRKLAFKLTPKLREKDKKYVKELTASATIWLGADGVPVAAESKIHVRGRALLVISFESEESESFAFANVGGRLVVTQHQKESKGSGAGEKSERKATTVLAVEKA